MTDLYQAQLDLEDEMLTLGVERYRERQTTATEKGRRSTTPGGLKLIGGGVPEVAAAIERWLKDCDEKLGRSPEATKYLRQVEPTVAAVIGLRVLLDSLSTATPYTRTAINIGWGLETEVRFREFRDQAPGLYAAVSKRLKAQSSHGGYRSKVLTYHANKADIRWDTWGTRARLQVGAALLEIIRVTTGLVEVIPSTYNGKRRRPLQLALTNSAMDWLDKYDQHHELLSPLYLPTLIQPLDWTGPYSGGYHTPAMGYLSLVKTRSRTYLQELKAWDMPDVYHAINTLQATAWRVNDYVWEVVQQLDEHGAGVAGLPPAHDAPLPPKPEDIDTNEDARKNWRRRAGQVWTENTKLKSRRLQMREITAVAERFADRDFFFPYQMDFRGRVYAVPSGLQPQGCDLARGLLTFAKTRPIGDQAGAEALMIHVANAWGMDKESFSDRIRWVEDHRLVIEQIAANPLDNRLWMDASSPFQFLAAAAEAVGYWSDGFAFESSLPVGGDATCSGLQHFSAMLLDQRGAEAVNLIASDKPNDIYSDVADRVRAKLHTEDSPDLIREAGVLTKHAAARMWLLFGIDRATVKRQVMTLPYGATQFAHRQFVRDHLTKRRDKGDIPPFNDEQEQDACTYLAAVGWEAINEIVVSARQAMGWLKDVARSAADDGLPVSWVTPSGFPVQQAYYKGHGTSVRLVTGEVIRKVMIQADTDEIDSRRQAQGLSPNFVHSLDAALLVLAVRRATERGVTSVTAVHDAFGCHAGAWGVFVQSLREVMVGIYHGTSVLDDLRQQLADVGIETNPIPERGSLDMTQVLDASYFVS